MAIPEAKYIRNEVILRDMQLTQDVKLARKSLIRWIALSLGLISPNETRTLMLDILESLFYFHFKEREPGINEIVDKVVSISRGRKSKGEEGKLDERTRVAKAVRYHLLQLKNKGLIERKKGNYTFVVDPMGETNDLSSAVEYIYRANSEPALEKVKTAIKTLERSY